MKPAKKNPRGSKGKFARCVEDVKARGSAYDPRAVCAASERKAYGQAELTTGNPSDYEAGKTAGEAGISRKAALAAHIRWVETVETRGTKLLPSERRILTQRFNDAYKSAARRNPAEASAAAYEKFHGEPPTQYITVTEKIHYHGHLWTVGTLEGLKILTVDGTSQVKLSGFRGAILAANEQAFAELSRTGKARAQLFIKNGDQSVHLEDFGIDPDRAHEVETLGRATAVLYETNKVHLGDEGGDAVYEHKFRRTREGDAEIKVKWARYPDVIYRVLDQRLEFAGGSYELIAEGINL